MSLLNEDVTDRLDNGNEFDNDPLTLRYNSVQARTRNDAHRRYVPD